MAKYQPMTLVPDKRPWPSRWSQIYYTVMPEWFRKAWSKRRKPPLGRAPSWASEY